MITNADVTIYNKVYDRDSGSNKYYRTVLKGVNWQDTTAVQPVESGIVTADISKIYIPFQAETEKQFRKPRNFLAENEKDRIFTIAPGDIIVKGVAETEIETKKDEEHMKNSVDDFRVIVSVDTNDNGSPHMQHWAVIAE